MIECYLIRLKLEYICNTEQLINVVGFSPDGYDSKLHIYTAINTYTVTVEAKSSLETKTATYTIYCEEKVTDNFLFTSNFPQDYALSKTYYKSHFIIDYFIFTFTGHVVR